ncbi:ABC transporter permease OS=Lysinibacillus sphaericus OX=1421 GN=LS41612_15865 PE=3 SV=1 [Lysinibacillus sphaericus]
MLLTIVATFAIAPLIAIMYYTFVHDGLVDVSQFSSMFANERLWQTLGNSLLLGVLVILGTTILALPMAFIRTKTTLQKYDWLDIVLTIPFIIPHIVLWMQLFMQNNAYIQKNITRNK